MSASGPVRVMIAPCEGEREAPSHQAEVLAHSFPKSWDFDLTGDPAAADVIFITDVRDHGDDYAKLRRHPLVRAYPSKCFSVDDSVSPQRWIRGIHTGATQSLLNLGRFRSGSFSLTHPNFRNQFVEHLAERSDSFERPRRYLLSFIGRACNPLRERILNHHYTRLDVHIRNRPTSGATTHDPFGHASSHSEYAEVLASSKFAICPRGTGAASIRWFEAMSLGVCPVILADDWLLPEGPDWKSFALFVKEGDCDNVEAIVTQHESEWRERGQIARATFNEYFSGDAYVKYLIRAALDIQASTIIPERLIQLGWLPALMWLNAKRRVQRVLKSHRADNSIDSRVSPQPR